MWRKLSARRGGINPIRRRRIIAGDLPWSRATVARAIHLALARLVRTRDILGRFFGGKAIMADALHWVVAIWVGFATKPVKSATAFSRAFVAVRVLWSSVWDQAQFARHTRASFLYPLLAVLYACVCSFLQQRQQGCDTSLRGSNSRARFCTDVEAGMGREYGV